MTSSTDTQAHSPWMNAADAAKYLKRGRRFVLREIKSGRLRGAIVGGKREVLTRAEWCDQWVEDHTRAVPFTPARRRRA